MVATDIIVQGCPPQKGTIKNRLWIVLKTVSDARFFINFDYKMSTIILHASIEFS